MRSVWPASLFLTTLKLPERCPNYQIQCCPSAIYCMGKTRILVAHVFALFLVILRLQLTACSACGVVGGSCTSLMSTWLLVSSLNGRLSQRGGCVTWDICTGSRSGMLACELSSSSRSLRLTQMLWAFFSSIANSCFVHLNMEVMTRIMSLCW